MTAESAGAQLARMRKTTTITCPQCGEMATVLERATYCSDRCRWRAANVGKIAARKARTAAERAQAAEAAEPSTASKPTRKRTPRAP